VSTHGRGADHHVVWLADATADRAREVGGKARGLQDLIALDLPVPDGFVITTETYLEAVRGSGLDEQIRAALTDAADHTAAETRIAELFTGLGIPSDAAEAVRKAVAALGDGPVAVRSSAVAEDRQDASFAGQQETELWVRGAEEIERSVVRCWASLYTGRAIGYRARFDVDPADVAIAVVVQRMVPARAAGVAMTLEPVTGDPTRVYLESAHGLGEGVVRGDVETDRFWVDKTSGAVGTAEIAEQTSAHLFDEDAGAVRLTALSPELGAAPSIEHQAAEHIAELACRIEQAQGRAMDIEWALDEAGTVHLVQARPETVWANRAPQVDWRAPSPMNFGSPPDATWSTTNAAEAVPGVQTPLGCDIFARSAERAFREAFHTVGALSAHEAEVPADRLQRILGFHYSRCALRVDLLCGWVDRLPGGDGEAMARGVFGHVPPGYVKRRQWRLYPRALAKMWQPFVRLPAAVRADRRRSEQFRARALAELPGLDLDGARRLLADASGRLEHSLVVHTSLVLGAIQPSFELLSKLAAAVGHDAQQLMAGHGGHDETVMVTDLWACSRGRLSLEDFLARHGYHGPREGDVSATVWREDPEPVRRLITTYRGLADDASPTAGQERGRARRAAAESAFLNALPRARRAGGRLALWLSKRYIPMRGTGKSAFLQNIDVIRAAARHLAALLVADGRLEGPDDIFMFTVDELATATSGDLRALAATRRALYAKYLTIDVPTVWDGAPDPILDTPAATAGRDAIDGVPASPGIVEAPVRVATDPSTCDIRPGEILVAHDTDPGWASLMFVSGGLVADIGGVMSHTGVVARELGIPCVVSTRTASRDLRTGDIVRLDGSAGRLHVVERAPAGGNDVEGRDAV
jgi:rifampicin phosphotransferase